MPYENWRGTTKNKNRPHQPTIKFTRFLPINFLPLSAPPYPLSSCFAFSPFFSFAFQETKNNSAAGKRGLASFFFLFFCVCVCGAVETTTPWNQADGPCWPLRQNTLV